MKKKADTTRLNVLLATDIHESLKKIATMKQTDITAIVSDCLGKYVDENQATVDWFDDVFVKNNRLDEQKNAAGD